MMMRYISFLAIVLFFFSCTEKTSIQPEYTGNTDWTPAITLQQNNYYRYEIEWASGPEISLEVERNISHFLYELKREGETDYTIIDSVDLARYKTIPLTYRSKPLLEELAGYSARMRVRYRDGTEHTSNEVVFTAPEVKGRVLKRIPFPDDPSYYPPYRPDYRPNAISFDGEYIYSIQGGFLTRIDTASGEARLLATNLDHIAIGDIGDISVHDDITFFFAGISNMGATLSGYNVRTQRTDVYLEIPRPDNTNNLRPFLYTGDDLYVMWEYRGGGSQVFRLDPMNGQVLETFPEISRGFYWFDYTFAFDGANIWIADYSSYFDYKIARFDPATGIIDSSRVQIPVFQPRGIAWDGSHFWVYEPETHSYAKMELEGI